MATDTPLLNRDTCPAEWHDRTITANGIRLHCVVAGTGEVVVLLHGFPEFWYSWRNQLPALAAAGFQSVAVDLRGYNKSDQPAEVHRYRVRELVEDLADLIQQVSDRAVFVIGHDWGGILAWRLAALYPELVRKLVILNAPHPAAFRQELHQNPRQWLRSSYVLFFQAPWLPERLLAANNFALLERTWREQPFRADAFTNEDIALYKQAFGGPDGLRGPINYYRAAIRYPQDLYGSPQLVVAPTLVLWGEQDPFLSNRLTRRLSHWATDLRVERIPDASHWVQNDASDEVNQFLIQFFGASGFERESPRL